MDIKRIRRKAGLTQAALASILGVGQSTVACWETGRAKPRADLLPKIAKACKCKIDKLYAKEA